MNDYYCVVNNFLVEHFELILFTPLNFSDILVAPSKQWPLKFDVDKVNCVNTSFIVSKMLMNFYQVY